jgi:chromosome segregation ATPase
VTETLQDLPLRSAQSVENASKQVGEAVGALASTLASGLEQSTAKLDKEASTLASTLGTITGTLKNVERQLKSIQMPDAIIEVKLQPTIRSMTKALKDLSDGLGSQVDNLQTAINELTTATQDARSGSEAVLAAQNHTSEQIAALLSSIQKTFQQTLDSLVAQQGSRDGESDMPEQSEGPGSPHRTLPNTDGWRNLGPAAIVTNAPAGRWPWPWR